MLLEVVVFAPALLVKSDCPITREALIPLLNGGVNFRTLLLRRSAIHRFPEESNAKPVGHARLFWLAEPLEPLVKLDWPITREADIPVVNGGVNSNVLLLMRSATHRLPEESNIIPEGACSPV